MGPYIEGHAFNAVQVLTGPLCRKERIYEFRHTSDIHGLGCACVNGQLPVTNDVPVQRKLCMIAIKMNKPVIYE